MKNKLTIITTLLISLNLTSCASTSEHEAAMQQIADQKSEITTLQTEQQILVEKTEQLENQLDQRLVSIETEVNLIALQQRTQEQEKKAALREEKRKARAARKFYMLQIASLDSLESVNKNWLAQQERHPKILNGLPARYQHAVIDGGNYYRLKVGEFNHKSDAIETCNALIARKLDCIVVNNTGTAL